MMDYKYEAEFPGTSGLAWYKPEQWALLRAESVDSDDLEETYGEWLEFAKWYLCDVWESGIDIFKVDVDVEEMVAWCKCRNRPLDGEARVEFVALKLKALHPE
jgi:hypothetical protein